MYSLFLNQKLTEQTIRPCYFFSGEEIFQAEQCVADIRQVLLSEEEDFQRERFNLAETSWMTVLDTARTVPFFQMSKRLLVVDIPVRKGEKLGPADRQELEAFLSSPSPHTVCVFIVHGKIRKNSVLFKLFSSKPIVLVKEFKPLKDRELLKWMNQKLEILGKRANPAAINRFLELVGNDLALLSNEMEKVATFAADREEIEEDDVNQMSGWMKSLSEYELSNAMEKKNYERCLIALNEQLGKEGARPEMILGLVARFFRDLLMAKLRLRMEKANKKAVLREIRPYLQEYFSDYRERFQDFFSLVDGMTLSELSARLQELAWIDLKNKTSDLSFQVMMEGFFYNFCKGRTDGATLERLP